MNTSSLTCLKLISTTKLLSRNVHLISNLAFKRSSNGERDLLKKLVSLDLITCSKYSEFSGMESKQLLTQMLSERRLREC